MPRSSLVKLRCVALVLVAAGVARAQTTLEYLRELETHRNVIYEKSLYSSTDTSCGTPLRVDQYKSNVCRPRDGNSGYALTNCTNNMLLTEYFSDSTCKSLESTETSYLTTGCTNPSYEARRAADDVAGLGYQACLTPKDLSDNDTCGIMPLISYSGSCPVGVERKLEVYSYGFFVGRTGGVFLDETNLLPSASRGINIVTMYPNNFTVRGTGIWDTYNNLTAYENVETFLESNIATGDLVVLFVYDEGSLKLPTSTRDKLHSIFGATKIYDLAFRDSYILVGYANQKAVTQTCSLDSEGRYAQAECAFNTTSSILYASQVTWYADDCVTSYQHTSWNSGKCLVGLNTSSSASCESYATLYQEFNGTHCSTNNVTSAINYTISASTQCESDSKKSTAEVVHYRSECVVDPRPFKFQSSFKYYTEYVYDGSSCSSNPKLIDVYHLGICFYSIQNNQTFQYGCDSEGYFRKYTYESSDLSCKDGRILSVEVLNRATNISSGSLCYQDTDGFMKTASCLSTSSTYLNAMGTGTTTSSVSFFPGTTCTTSYDMPYFQQIWDQDVCIYSADKSTVQKGQCLSSNTVLDVFKTTQTEICSSSDPATDYGITPLYTYTPLDTCVLTDSTKYVVGDEQATGAWYGGCNDNGAGQFGSDDQTSSTDSSSAFTIATGSTLSTAISVAVFIGSASWALF